MRMDVPQPVAVTWRRLRHGAPRHASTTRAQHGADKCLPCLRKGVIATRLWRESTARSPRPDASRHIPPTVLPGGSRLSFCRHGDEGTLGSPQGYDHRRSLPLVRPSDRVGQCDAVIHACVRASTLY